MQEILFDYRLNPTTWAYISSLMMIGIYFKFHRFWSVRNLDLAGLIAFTPALLLIYYGLLKNNSDLIRAGYVWLFAVDGFFLVRLLLDPMMVRRPLLEPNLSASGLAFTGISMLVFLMANVITSPPERLEGMLAQQEAPTSPDPGYQPFHTLGGWSGQTPADIDQSQPEAYRLAKIHAATGRAVTIAAHLAVVVGMLWIGFRHFGNVHTGAAAATLYLLTFCTSQLTSQVNHVAPAALLVWAVAAYRRPTLAGALIGTAGGLIYYPLYLLPLWCGFYLRRGLFRFLCGVLLMLAIMVGCLALSSIDLASFNDQVELMFGWRNFFAVVPTGFWQYCESAYRIPVITTFVVISLGLALWPVQKNLGTLLSCSAAVMVGAQFWHVNQGGLCMAWYLPLLILTIFRPNLEDRVALSAVRPLWRRKT
jgi:hypothetical protein